jgi:hypothetical protein
MPGLVPGIDVFSIRRAAFGADALGALDARMATFDSSFDASSGGDGGDGGGGAEAANDAAPDSWPRATHDVPGQTKTTDSLVTIAIAFLPRSRTGGGAGISGYT